ncbi:MAG: hypothetical protein H0V79_05865 [Actinobacteria bacterium]|nr:hypothetical protein [Actinomycetota bacterium]
MNDTADLRTVAAGEETKSGASPLRPAFAVNGLAELVADVIEQTGLINTEQAQAVRARARTGSFAQGLIEEGLAAGDRVAGALAARFGLSLVDLHDAGISPDSAKPLHVLERVVAIPYKMEDGILRVAIADPQNVNAIDELKLATCARRRADRPAADGEPHLPADDLPHGEDR